MARNSSGNIRQFRKPININLGMIIFGVIFIYIIICIFLYFRSKHIAGYEVQMGSLAVDNVYHGIALRNEEIEKSTLAGYVNYFAKEGARVGYNQLVYSVDETGKIADLLAEKNNDENALSEEDLTEVKNEIVGFSSNFNAHSFQSTYDFKYNLSGTVLKLANKNVLNSIKKISANNVGEIVNFCNSPQSGIVVYSTDGLEKITPDKLTEKYFDQKNYKRKQLISNELVSKNDPVYKLVLSENWSVVIPVDKNKAKELEKAEYVNVTFLKNQESSWGKVTIFHNSDKKTYAQLSFTNSMISFCKDRYLDIELTTEDERGLKIPNSSIVKKQFFLVPEAYITRGGKDDSTGVLKETYTENGQKKSTFIPAQIYGQKDGQYYIDDSTLRMGDNLIKTDSTEKYTLSKQGTLIGVYNINKGYADFRQIQILYQNEDYSIVKSNTTYGLSTYDYIVLDASVVNEDDFVYE